MVKFTEEDKKWLEAHNAKKISFDNQENEEYEIVIIDNRVKLVIENSPYDNNFEVNIISQYMKNINAYGADMIKTIQLCFDYWRRAKTRINQNENALMNFEL